MPAERLGEVRLADNNGEYELHMYPGSGIIDFADTFRRIEATGYAGHYTAAFGTIEDMLRARPLLTSIRGALGRGVIESGTGAGDAPGVRGSGAARDAMKPRRGRAA